MQAVAAFAQEMLGGKVIERLHGAVAAVRGVVVDATAAVTPMVATVRAAADAWERPANVNEAVQWFVLGALVHTLMYPICLLMSALTIAVMHTGNPQESLNFQAAWVAVAIAATLAGFHMQVFWGITCAHIASLLGQRVFEHGKRTPDQRQTRSRTAASRE